MDIFIPNFIKYQLYLLQLENYELGRYWKLLRARGFFPSSKRPLRKELVWTAKAKALMLMAGALHVFLVVIAALVVLVFSNSLDVLASVVAVGVIVFLPLYFFLFSFALVAVKPLDKHLKNKLVNQARAKLSTMNNLVVIAIAGSYGKTTMKQMLNKVLSAKLEVLATPDSINTPVGIARFILNKLTSRTRVLILELGEHYRGDVKELCELAPPDITVITGINEAHAERMGGLENITATIFEAVEFAQERAIVVMNGDDVNVFNNYSKVINGRRAIFYSAGGNKQAEYVAADKKFNAETLVWECLVKNINYTLPLLGEYAVGTCAGVVAVAEQMGLSGMDIQVGLTRMEPVEHRLQPLPSSGDILVIDDSYNGNPDGVREAINVLSKFSGRRKVFITPGLVEMGESSADIHRQIGRQLAGVVDVVILIKTSVAGYIEEGIEKEEARSKNGGPKIMWFDTAVEAHENLKNILKPGDVVVFQNDWGDQYI